MPLALPTDSTWGLFGRYMIFPNDPEMRQRAIKLAATEHAVDLMDAGQLSPEKIKNLVRAAIDVISPHDLGEKERGRVDRGYQAGMILYNCCLRARRGERAVLKRAKDEIDDVVGRGKGKTSKHLDEVVWKEFKSVAPFWAAYIWFEENMTVEDLPQFLKVSEELRVLGETTKPYKSNSILSPGECYRLSDDLAALLPTGTLTPA